jgi:hypothetical protein
VSKVQSSLSLSLSLCPDSTGLIDHQCLRNTTDHAIFYFVAFLLILLDSRREVFEDPGRKKKKGKVFAPRASFTKKKKTQLCRGLSLSLWCRLTNSTRIDFPYHRTGGWLRATEPRSDPPACPRWGGRLDGCPCALIALTDSLL